MFPLVHAAAAAAVALAGALQSASAFAGTSPHNGSARPFGGTWAMREAGKRVVHKFSVLSLSLSVVFLIFSFFFLP